MTTLISYLNALKIHLKVKYLDWRYYYAVKKAMQTLDRGKYQKRVFVILDDFDRLVVVDRKTFRSLKRFKSLDRNMKMPDLRRNSIFYFPAYDTDVSYGRYMENKKKRYMEYFLPKNK